MNFDLSPLLGQLAKNEGATVALAKLTLSEDQFKLFLVEQQIQTCYSWLDIYELNKQLFSNSEVFISNTEKTIEKLKKEKLELIKELGL